MDISVRHPDYTDGDNYLVACARIRDVSVATLVRELVKVVCRDQLVLAILDDDEQPHAVPRYARRFREARRH